MLALLLHSSLALGAPGDAPPEATARVAADGSFTLHLQAPFAWQSAEVVVDGGRALLVGPTEPFAQVELRGVVEEPDDSLSVGLSAVTADAVGVSFEFEVDAEQVPVATPSVGEDAPTRRRLWHFGRGGGPRP